MRRRLTIIICAIAIAIVGVTAALRTGATDRETAGVANRTTSALVATQRIEPGTPAGEVAGSVERAQVPDSVLMPGALTDLEQVAGLRAVGPILPGQQIVADQWQSGASPLQPPTGRLGLSVQLSDPQRVAGFVVPGSRVAVFATVPDAAGGLRTRLLLSPITVLGVGGSTLATRVTEADGQTSTEQVPSAILTLALTTDQAERVVLASAEGQLHLGLLGGRAAVPVTGGPGVTAATLFGGAS